MSSGVVYNCITCSETVEGKQHYASCVLCSRRVHRKCYGGGLSNSTWTRIRKIFTCTACEAGRRGQNFNSSFSDGERQFVIEESMEKTHGVSSYVQPTTIKYKLLLVHLKWEVKLLVTGVVTHIGRKETIQV